MFKKHEDGTYSFSSRFWVQVIVLGLLIVMIGYSTQRTASRTEDLSRETIAYAKQTNDCLNQVVATLKDRTALNAQLDALATRRDAANLSLVNEIGSIPEAGTPEQRREGYRLARAHYTETRAQIDRERAELLEQRAAKPYPDPSCGNKLPGE